VNVANLVEGWRVLVEHIGEKFEFCPLLDCKERIEVKASSWKTDFPKEFERVYPKNLTQIQMRCGHEWI
jgi:hypothetical protein